MVACAIQASPMSQSDIEQLVQKLQALHQSKPSIEANFREERHTALLKDPLVSQGKVPDLPLDAARSRSFSLDAARCRSMPRSMPLVLARCRSMPLDAARCRSMPLHAARCRSMPLDATRSRSMPLDAARSRSVPLDMPLDAARSRSMPLDRWDGTTVDFSPLCGTELVRPWLHDVSRKLSGLSATKSLPRGVTVAQVTLDHFVMVRIHARQRPLTERLTQAL
jgi:hypothetical protein